MSDEVEPAGVALPAAFARVLADYERYLVAERNLTAHTVRAYLGDVTDLLEHAVRLGHDGVATIDVAVLRSWLARQHTLGKARTTLARRATSARMSSGPR